MANKTMTFGQNAANGVDVTVNGAINQLFTPTVAAAAANNNGTYTPLKWNVNAGVSVKDGTIVCVKMPSAGHDYGVFLSVDNGTNYYPIRLRSQDNSRLTTQFPQNSILMLQYNSSLRVDNVFPLTGGTARTNITGAWIILNNYNDGNDIQTYTEYAGETTGSVGIVPYSIIMRTSADRWDSIVTTSSTATTKARNTAGFRVGSELYHTGNYTVAANTGLSGAWRSIYSYIRRIDFRYSSNCGTTLTANKPVYLVGTITNGYFYLDATWWTQTTPTTKNNKVYILVGGAYNTYQVDLYEHNEWFWHDGTAFTKYGGSAQNAANASVATNLSSSPSVTWTDGTNNGPAISVTAGGKSSQQMSIPSASASKSGIVTTGQQTFAGDKTFADNIVLTQNKTYGLEFPTNNVPQTGQLFFKVADDISNRLLPYGGDKGTFLVKISDNDYDVAWTNNVDGSLSLTGNLTATKVFGAVWNDYAEYRQSYENVEKCFGRCFIETGNDIITLSTARLQPAPMLCSDTFGFAIGKTDEANIPIAVSGRVLAYPYEERSQFNVGDAVCSGPDGTVSLMTREEIINYPERILGIVSSIPEYEFWNGNKVKVDKRIWIKVK